MAQLIINKVTYNTISVTWKDVPCKKLTHFSSPSFTLITDRHRIPFFLSIAESTLKVTKKGSGIGRGIVSVVIAQENTGPIVKTYINEAWRQWSSFHDTPINLTDTSTNLTIDCKIIWLGSIDDISNPEYPPSLLSIENVPFDNTLYPDFTIIVEGQEIPSHRAILAGHSPVFLTMFKTPMEESKETKVEIEDIQYSTMKTLLKIIYTGKTEDLNDIVTALRVLQAAVKYEMSTIRILCEYKLQHKIQADNVLMLLVKAHKCGAWQFCNTCVSYILAADKYEINEELKRIVEKPNIALAVMDVLMEQLSSVFSQKNQ